MGPVDTKKQGDERETPMAGLSHSALAASYDFMRNFRSRSRYLDLDLDWTQSPLFLLLGLQWLNAAVSPRVNKTRYF